MKNLYIPILGLGITSTSLAVEVILLPTYPLSPSEYIVKIRDVNDEKRFIVQLKNRIKYFKIAYS